MLRSLIITVLCLSVAFSLAGCFHPQAEGNHTSITPSPEALSQERSELQDSFASSLPFENKSHQDAAKEAVAQQLEDFIKCDTETMAILLETYVDTQVAGATSEFFEALVNKIDYALGNAHVDKNTAIVDLTVTVPDLAGSMKALALQVIGRYAVEQALGVELPGDSSILAQATALLDSEELLTVTHHTAVYLAMGGDGQWKIDLSNPNNLDFVNCLTGGLLDLVSAYLSPTE